MIQRVRKKSKDELLAEFYVQTVEAFWFGGKKNKGTVVKDKDGVTRRIEEEHTTYVDQPLKFDRTIQIYILHLCGVVYDYSYYIIYNFM